MKGVLGVLADDVLGPNASSGAAANLEKVDPRRLAAGKKEEMLYIGEVLCWVGRRMGYLRVDAEGRPVKDDLAQERRAIGTQRRSGSPTQSTASQSTCTGHGSSLLVHSMRSAGVDESQTSVSALDVSRDVAENENEGEDEEEDYRHHHRGPPSVASDETATGAGPGPSTRRMQSRTIRANRADDFLPRSSSPRPRHVSTRTMDRKWEREGSDAASSADENYADEDEGDDSSGPSFCPCSPELELSPSRSIKPIIRGSGYLEEKSIDEELETFHSQRKTRAREAGHHHDDDPDTTITPASMKRPQATSSRRSRKGYYDPVSYSQDNHLRT